MATIADQLASHRRALSEAQSSGDASLVRRLDEQIKALESFQERHPDQSEAPTPMEVFCDLNPSNPNCLVYDD